MPRTKDYEQMTIVELRRLGGRRGVPHAWDLRKADLVAALKRLGRTSRTTASKAPARKAVAGRAGTKRRQATKTAARRRATTRRPR